MSLSSKHRNPSQTTLRWFGAYVFLLSLGLALWQLNSGYEGTALILSVLALVMSGVTALRPGWLRPVFVASLIVTYPIGWALSHVLLALIYFGMFTPLNLLFRCLGRDALGLQIRPDYNTYWSTKPVARDVRSYFRLS